MRFGNTYARLGPPHSYPARKKLTEEQLRWASNHSLTLQVNIRMNSHGYYDRVLGHGSSFHSRRYRNGLFVDPLLLNIVAKVRYPFFLLITA